MSMSNDDGKRLEIWTEQLFRELGYRTAPTESERRKCSSDGAQDGFFEIVYAKQVGRGTGRRFVPPMFQVDVQYWNWLGEKIICECKNYRRIRDLNIDETLLELLAKTQLSGAAQGQLIIPAKVASRKRKEGFYRGAIRIFDLGDLERLDMSRRRRHPVKYLFRSRPSVRDQLDAVDLDPAGDYRRHYYAIRSVDSETMERYRPHIHDKAG